MGIPISENGLKLLETLKTTFADKDDDPLDLDEAQKILKEIPFDKFEPEKNVIDEADNITLLRDVIYGDLGTIKDQKTREKYEQIRTQLLVALQTVDTLTKPPDAKKADGKYDITNAKLIKEPYTLKDAVGKDTEENKLWSNYRTSFKGKTVTLDRNKGLEIVKKAYENGESIEKMVKALWENDDYIKVNGESVKRRIFRMEEITGVMDFLNSSDELKGKKEEFFKEMTKYINATFGKDAQFTVDSLLALYQSTDWSGKETQDLKQFINDLITGIAKHSETENATYLENSKDDKQGRVLSNYDGNIYDGRVYGSLALVKGTDGNYYLVEHATATPINKTRYEFKELKAEEKKDGGGVAPGQAEAAPPPKPAAAGSIEEKLITAAKKRDSQEVERLLAIPGINVNAEDEDGKTALHWAASNEYQEIVEVLIENKADVNAKDKDGVTALMEAAWYGYHKIAGILILEGAKVNAKNDLGSRALHWAASKGHTKVVELLLQVEETDINAEDNDGDTALHRAASKGHTKVVELLLRANEINVNAKNLDGKTALDLAREHNNEAIVKQLEEKIKAQRLPPELPVAGEKQKNQDPLSLEFLTNLKQLLNKNNIKMQFGRLDGSIICLTEKIEEIQKKIQGKDDEYLIDLMTLIQLILHPLGDDKKELSQDYPETAKQLTLLLEKVEEKRIELLEEKLIKAAGDGNLEEVKKLLNQEGINVNAKDAEEWTPLTSAACNGYQEVVEVLIEKGADVNAKDDRGTTALHWAASKGHQEVVEVLIKKGAEVNAKDKYGNTALYQATINEKVEVVKVLIDQGAEVNAKDTEQSTPLMGAAHNGYKEIVEVLIEKGAEVNAKDKYGNTALTIAAKRGHKEVAQLLANKEIEGINKTYKGKLINANGHAVIIPRLENINLNEITTVLDVLNGLLIIDAVKNDADLKSQIEIIISALKTLKKQLEKTDK